ncbi:MAG: hypothetical protein HOC77_09540 [Chloroflexi bacterium]|nr:hypothetical protein [Chloroflexota bacterium]MBT4073904.1 hypothetical protein [Chloroflexota bacterium]MBT4515316.1 hypothetical protein [Chloroflexota bacterium]MBT5319025.1 hypothetical protein [Chloroflexota bacterium]MBT6683155.1 hypothetical protein [Chloroflexota bacterium]
MKTVPRELLMSIFHAITSAEENGLPPLTAGQLAIQFRQTDAAIKKACAVLEANGKIQASVKSPEHPDPSYTPISPADGVVQISGAEAPAQGMNSILKATIHTFRAGMNLDLRLVGQAVSEDQVTTEDLSIYARVTGDLEGSVCFGIRRDVARLLLSVIARRRVGTIGQAGLSALHNVADRIVVVARADLAKYGYSIDVSPSSTVYPMGMKITTHGVPQAVATLKCRYGAVAVHVVLQESPQQNEDGAAAAA